MKDKCEIQDALKVCMWTMVVRPLLGWDYSLSLLYWDPTQNLQVWLFATQLGVEWMIRESSLILSLVQRWPWGTSRIPRVLYGYPPWPDSLGHLKVKVGLILWNWMGNVATYKWKRSENICEEVKNHIMYTM